MIQLESFESVIANILALVELEVTQFDDKVEKGLIFQ